MKKHIGLVLVATVGLFQAFESVAQIPNGRATNRSYATTCAEDDNINVPIRARNPKRFEIVATHPTYDVGTDNCSVDFSGCGTVGALADTCTTLWDDGINVVQVCTVSDWWRPTT